MENDEAGKENILATSWKVSDSSLWLCKENTQRLQGMCLAEMGQR